MLNSLHLTLDFPPMSHGGISTAVGALVRVLSAQTGRVGVISYDEWRPRNSKGVPDDIHRSQDLWRLRTPKAARSLITSEPFEGVGRVVVHHPLLWEDGLALSRRVNAPADFVVHVDALHVADLTNRELPPQYLQLQERIVREATRLVALSRDVFNRWSANYPDASIHLAPLPLAVQNEITPKLGNEAILSVGRFDYVKGTDILGETISTVLSQQPECRWTHVGGNPASPKTERRWKRKLEGALSKTQLERFKVLPWLAPDELKTQYRNSALVVVPSRYETFGLVAREAISHAVPVVAFDVGGLKDILTDGVTGRQVEEITSAALAKAVVGAIDELGVQPRCWSDGTFQRSKELELQAERSWLGLYRA